MNTIAPKIFVAGHRGMVGSAIVRHLLAQGHPADRIVTRTRDQLDLLDQAQVRAFFSEERPAEVYLAAAMVGGIHANSSYPADFIYQNLMMQTNVIHEAFQAKVKKLLCLGSSCIYPKSAPQPMKENALLTGPLEPTNEPYAIAKIAGIKLCESYNRQYGFEFDIDYRSIMPANLYGPGDNYHPVNSHVIPALIRRLHDAKRTQSTSVTIWGTGTPRREFLYVDDLARACVHLMNLEKAAYDAATRPMLSHINAGCGQDVTIKQLAELVADVVGFDGHIEFDPQRPDGPQQKLLDSSCLNSLGWKPTVELNAGLTHTYADFLRRYST